MTHINGFLELESPNFDPNHAFLSSIEAEIITFLSKKAAILFFLSFMAVPEAPHTKNGAFIRSVTVTQNIDLNRPHYHSLRELIIHFYNQVAALTMETFR